MRTLPHERPLSERHKEILRLLCAGKRSYEIADDFGVNPRTVRAHIENLKERLGARTTVQAAVMFSRTHGEASVPTLRAEDV